MFVEVAPDVAVGPVGDGVRLPAAVPVFHLLDAAAAVVLAAAQAGDPQQNNRAPITPQ